MAPKYPIARMNMALLQDRPARLESPHAPTSQINERSSGRNDEGRARDTAVAPASNRGDSGGVGGSAIVPMPMTGLMDSQEQLAC